MIFQLSIFITTITKDYNIKIAKKYIKTFLEEYIIISADKKLLYQAINSNFNDFEDGVQYFCAKKADANFIMTNDKKGFKNSDIETINSIDFYNRYVL